MDGRRQDSGVSVEFRNRLSLAKGGAGFPTITFCHVHHMEVMRQSANGREYAI